MDGSKQKEKHNNKGSEERIHEIKSEIKQIWDNPFSLMGDLEKDNFKHYCKRWDNEPRVGRLFRESNSDFFPLLYSEHIYENLDELWKLDNTAYVEILSECKYPYLLHDYLSVRTGLDDQWDILFEILSQAPVCGNNALSSTVMSEELSNVLAPVLVSVIGWYLIDLGGNNDMVIDQDNAEKFVSILSLRTDGFFLAYHYAKYLLWKSNHTNKEKIQKYSDFLSILTEPFREQAVRQFYNDGTVRYIPESILNEGIIAEPKKAMDDYVATGRINSLSADKSSDSSDIDLLLNYRTVKWFLNDEKYANALFVAFNQMFAYDSLSFVNNDFKARLVYYEMAELFMAQGNLFEAWTETNDSMLAMKQRLQKSYYGDKSNEMNYCIRFMWNVNLVLLPYLYEAELDDKMEADTAKKFWNMIWKDGIDYIRRYSRFCGTEIEEYLCRLICYYLVCFIRNGENSPVDEEKETSVRVLGPKRGRPYKTGLEDQIKKDEQIDKWITDLMPVFEQIEEIPIVVLRAIVQLLANGLRWEVVLGGSNGNFFYNEFMRANEIAIGQRIYDWVGRFLRQKGFTYRKSNEMYFLDTNALYWYIGRDKMGDLSSAKVDDVALRNFLDAREDKALASSAYVEAMVKFRNHPEKAEELHRFLISKNLRIFNNVQYQTFSTDQMSVNLSLSGKPLADYIKKEILPVKIDIEYRFSIGFFMSILLLYTKYKLDESKKICPDHEVDIELFVRDKAVEEVCPELKKALTDAYENHELHEQQILKDKYIELLERECQMVDSLIEILSTMDFNLTDKDIREVEERVEKKYKNMKSKKPENYLMDHIHNTLLSQPSFKEVAKKKFAEMYSIKGKAFKGKEKYAFCEIQTDYLVEEMYTSWMDNGQKFRKNDIFDFFFLGCAEFKDDRKVDNILIDTSTYLLTFDKKLDRYIERRNPNNGKVIRRFYDDF